MAAGRVQSADRRGRPLERMTGQPILINHLRQYAAGRTVGYGWAFINSHCSKGRMRDNVVSLECGTSVPAHSHQPW
jgi:hypothetical protein